MSWFNLYGLLVVTVIMIPNIVLALTDKTAFENACKNKAVLALEQIGRYACIAFTIFNVPYTYYGFWFSEAPAVYLVTVGLLLLLYCLGWVVFQKKSTAKMLWLSITPTALFLFGGVMLLSAPLIVSSILFGVGHITVSYQNRK